MEPGIAGEVWGWRCHLGVRAGFLPREEGRLHRPGRPRLPGRGARQPQHRQRVVVAPRPERQLRRPAEVLVADLVPTLGTDAFYDLW